MSWSRHGGLSGYSVLWAGQILSVSAARMVNFGFGVWLFMRTHSALDLSLLTGVAFVATMVCSPFAGAAIDRLPRRLTIAVGDAGTVVVLATLLALFAWNGVQVWELFLANTIIGVLVAFEVPAYSATISLMVSKQDLSRANAMRTIADSVQNVVAPTLGAIALRCLGINTVVLIAVLAGLVAVGTVFLVKIPQPDRTAACADGWWQGAGAGFRYIAARPALIGLQLTFFVVSMLSVMGWQVLTPMVLLRTGNDELAAGLVQTVGAVGGVVGGVVMLLRPPAVRPVRSVLLAVLAYYSLGRIVLGMGDGMVEWAASWFCSWACMPFLRGNLDAIWQVKVDPAMQGRVFGARQVIDNLALPLALAVVGPLADTVLEPGMQPGGALLKVFGSVVPGGPGGGMALVFFGTGVLGVLVGLCGFFVRTVRDADTALPDHDMVPELVTSA
ncbi:MFS transporter [Kutzneria buriramensis]|uniref:MFS transporter n=1 Tax=Kutzneria buriramensis TaxID=1045776 RepID=UPI0014777D73|nr:MFS transporter [Kutzneria buriramensis]